MRWLQVTFWCPRVESPKWKPPRNEAATLGAFHNPEQLQLSNYPTIQPELKGLRYHNSLREISSKGVSLDSWMYPYQRTNMGDPYIGPT